MSGSKAKFYPPHLNAVHSTQGQPVYFTIRGERWVKDRDGVRPVDPRPPTLLEKLARRAGGESAKAVPVTVLRSGPVKRGPGRPRKAS